MFTINSLKEIKTDHEILEITSEEFGVFANINLSLGASLQIWDVNSKTLISTEGMVYEQAFNSSILFPFPNRIHHGRYIYKGKEFQLPINITPENNAIHGLVYDKDFRLIEKKVSKNEASVLLRYEERNALEGFPYRYSIDIAYTFNKDKLKIKIHLKNEDNLTFPFALGWHPYFSVKELYKARVKMKANSIYTNDTFEPWKSSEEFNVGDKQFDDCFLLENNVIELSTSEYDLKISTSDENMYLQLYTPQTRDTIAIEPMTAAPNSFNNTIGLKELMPGQEYVIEYKVEVDV